jgi:hypothetical protein
MTETRPKNPHAVALGRKGGKASRKNLSEEEKRRLARKAAQVRWTNARKAKHP